MDIVPVVGIEREEDVAHRHDPHKTVVAFYNRDGAAMAIDHFDDDGTNRIGRKRRDKTRGHDLADEHGILLS